ncbi:uncharacterized protein LOC116027001 [Ipomoea triloba]|uniref:uncharacterized protein LOC116027001 n=1 Tax=Ipomoea triloba TaxID=35885 RepID=UPI00125DBF52|nr:uncharacterized protein LOC116027001 [Ipomoea triloba]
MGGRPRHANVVVNEKQIANEPAAPLISKNAQAPNGDKRPTGSVPRRAAEEEEHVIVRGENGGNVIESTRVHTGETRTEVTPSEDCPSQEHHVDPPDDLDYEGDVVMEVENDDRDTHREECIVWNCQGACGRDFHRVLKNMILTHKPAILSLVEPKVSGSHADAICKRLGFSDWVRVREVSQACWFFAVVYGSPTHHLCCRLWGELAMGKRGIQGPLLVAGDFNSVISQDETSNYSAFSIQRSSEFAEWIRDEGLIDMGFSGPKLTWVRSDQSGYTKGARLDRALCNISWRHSFPDATVIHLPRISSDHTPLLIQTEARILHNTEAPFQFQAACRKRVIMARLGGVQHSLTQHTHGGLVKLEKALIVEYQEILNQEELLWYQRSHEDWIVSGDRNTSYYHTAATIRKSQNTIITLRDDNGEWISNTNLLKTHVSNYYASLFSACSNTIFTDALESSFPRVPQDDWRVFNMDITKEEVRSALFDMAPFKAPGPDGFRID